MILYFAEINESATIPNHFLPLFIELYIQSIHEI